MLRPAIVYIGGSGRSGSTVLARMVGQHPGFAAVGELRYVLERGAIQNHLCGCGEPFRSCPFWTEVFTRVLGGFDEDRCQQLLAQSRRVDRIRYIALLVAPPRRRPRRFQARLEVHGRFLVDLYSAIAEVAGVDTIVDSSKDPSYAFLLRSVEALNVSVLHLIRDSRAVAYSWTRSKVRPEIHWKVEYMRKRRPLRAALLWSECNVLFEAIGRGRGPLRHLRYEDFTEDPVRHVADIVDWAGASAGPGVTGPGRPQRPPTAPGRPQRPPTAPDRAFCHDISGNPMRFSPTAAVVTRDDEWRASMPAGSRRLVTAVTLPLLLRYHYRLDGRDRDRDR